MELLVEMHKMENVRTNQSVCNTTKKVGGSLTSLKVSLKRDCTPGASKGIDIMDEYVTMWAIIISSVSSVSGVWM